MLQSIEISCKFTFSIVSRIANIERDIFADINKNKVRITGNVGTLRVNVLKYVMLFAISYHLDNLKNVENNHGGVFFTFFELYKWYQIAQSVSNVCYMWCSCSNDLKSGKVEWYKILNHKIYVTIFLAIDFG